MINPTPRFSGAYLQLDRGTRDGSESLSLKNNLRSVIPTAISEVTAEEAASGHRGSTFTSSMVVISKPKNESFCSNQDPEWWKPDHPYHQAHYGSAKKKDQRICLDSAEAGPKVFSTQTYLLTSKEQFALKPRIKGFYESQTAWEKIPQKPNVEKLQSAKLFFKRESVKKHRTQSYTAQLAPQVRTPAGDLKESLLADKPNPDKISNKDFKSSFSFNSKLEFHRRNISSNFALSSERVQHKVPSASTQRQDINSSVLEVKYPDMRQLIEFNRLGACEPQNSLPRDKLLTSKILQKLSQSRRETKSSVSLYQFLQDNRLIDEKNAVSLVKHKLIDPQLDVAARKALLKKKASKSYMTQY